MNKEIEILAKTMWGEARGEGNIGMIAVGHVIANRVKDAIGYGAAHGKPHPLFGDGTVVSACLAKKQFSCWNKGDSNLVKMNLLTEENEIYLTALHLATRIISGTDNSDPTNGAKFYYNPKIVQPKWAEGITPSAIIGNHVFLRSTK